MTDAGLRLRSDLDSEQSVVRSSALGYDEDFEDVDSHLKRELELLQERFVRQDDEEMLRSADDRMTVEIGIQPNGAYYS